MMVTTQRGRAKVASPVFLHEAAEGPFSPPSTKAFGIPGFSVFGFWIPDFRLIARERAPTNVDPLL
jgi:hypothetical protein